MNTRFRRSPMQTPRAWSQSAVPTTLQLSVRCLFRRSPALLRRTLPLFGALLAVSCSSPKRNAAESEALPAVEDKPILVKALPNVEINEGKMLLGRRLFHDTLLSGDHTLSCASCHSLAHGGAEPHKVSTGIRGQEGPINAPTVLNARFNFVQFWDGRAATLEEQAAGPVANPIEMGADWNQVVEEVAADPWYGPRFATLYPGEPVTKDRITDAIAEYERMLVTPSPFDAYLKGDENALGADAKAGFLLFRNSGCQACHDGVNVGGTSFQKLGAVRNYFEERGTPVTQADLGRFNVTRREADRHQFKVPTLRNVALTPPYFHDGSRQTLGDAIRAMGRYQLALEFSDGQVRQLVAFLESLSGKLPDRAAPEEVPTRAARTSVENGPATP